MTDFTDKCIVLKISDYRDDDKLAKVLTADHGMVTVLMKGVKKAKAKLKPFAQVFAVFDTRLLANRGTFLTIVDPLLIQDGFSLCADLKVFTAASVAAEATVAAIGDDEPHPMMFLEFLKLLKALIACESPYYLAAAYTVKLLALSGFFRDYGYTDAPKTPAQALGYAQKHGYDKAGINPDLDRRALKFVCAEFERRFEIGLKSVDSIDLYG